MAWGSTHKINFCKIHLKEKHVIYVICNENKFTHTKPFMRLQVLNVFKHYKIPCVHTSYQSL